MKNIYIKIVLLTGLLVGSQVFANNSITTSIDTQGVSKIDEIKAFYIVTDIAHGRSWNYITITSTKSGASGNGDDSISTTKPQLRCFIFSLRLLLYALLISHIVSL
jgi:hypothetical protein